MATVQGNVRSARCERPACALATNSNATRTAFRRWRQHVRCRSAQAAPDAHRGDGCLPGRSSRKQARDGNCAHVSAPALQLKHPDLSSWREFRAKLVREQHQQDLLWKDAMQARWPSMKQWCHRIPAVETACVLLANQPGLGFFERAVVLIVEHTPERTLGLVLNRVSALDIKDLNIDEDIARCFGMKSLRLGGCVRHSELYLLHGQSSVKDAHPVCPGLYTGGLTTAMQLICDGGCRPRDFALLAGYASWTAGQVEAEVARGAWIPVSMSSEYILDLACDDHRSMNAWHELFQRVSEPDRNYCGLREDEDL